MQLHVVPAQAPPGATFPHNPIPAPQMQACINVYAGIPDEAARAEFSRLAAQLKTRHQWLACDCNGDLADPPMLHARRTATGLVTLVRMPSRRPHDRDCPFYLEPGSGVTRSPAPERPDGLVPEGGFAILKPIRGATRGHAGEREACRHMGERMPRLARVLFSLLHQTGLLRSADGKVPPLPDQYDSLRRTLGQLHLHHSMPELTLNRVTALHPDQVPAVVERLKGHTWSADVAPQAFLITPVHDVQGRTVIAGSVTAPQTLTLATDPVLPGMRTPGPFLGCFLIGPSDPMSTRDFGLLRAYLHPMLDRRWLCPVDSALERAVLPVLRGQQAYWAKAHDVRTTLEKPVFPITRERPLIPDIILHHPPTERRIFVEVMGFDDAGYLERKQRVHAELKEYGPIIPIRKHDLDGDNLIRLKKRLTAIVLNTFVA